MSLASKIGLYAKSALVQRSLNWRGLPLIPKRLVRGAPHNRAAFNEFVLWTKSLGLSGVQWIVDVGANHGDFSQAAAALYPEARVLLVEPLPHLRTALERHCRSRGWRLADCALGSTPGKATFYIDPQNDAIGSLLGFSEAYRSANPRLVAQRSLECRVMTLDALCEAEGINAIDLLKVDVEGFEFEALKGGPRILLKTRALVLELSLIRRAPGAEDGLLEMLSLLRKYGFEIVNVVPSVFARAEPWKPVEFNILARRSDGRP